MVNYQIRRRYRPCLPSPGRQDRLVQAVVLSLVISIRINMRGKDDRSVVYLYPIRTLNGSSSHRSLLPVAGTIQDDPALVDLPHDGDSVIIIRCIIICAKLMAAPFIHQVDGKRPARGQGAVTDSSTRWRRRSGRMPGRNPAPYICDRWR